MLGDPRSSTNSCGGSTIADTTTTTITDIVITTKTTNPIASRTMSSMSLFRVAVAFIVIVYGCPIIMVNGAPYGALSVRLCSKGLSDALYLVCKDHGGYNEPLSYSGEDYSHQPAGLSLVEECCYQSCTYQQLEQYCKPASDEKDTDTQDGIEESLRIVNLPDASGRELIEVNRTGAAVEDNEKTQ